MLLTRIWWPLDLFCAVSRAVVASLCIYLYFVGSACQLALFVFFPNRHCFYLASRFVFSSSGLLVHSPSASFRPPIRFSRDQRAARRGDFRVPTALVSFFPHRFRSIGSSVLDRCSSWSFLCLLDQTFSGILARYVHLGIADPLVS